MSHEIIYQDIYADRSQGGDLCRHLRCQKKRRKRYAGGRERRGKIIGLRPISERPAHIESRLRLGHWEGDIVDKHTRSRMMAGIKAKNTKPELELRRIMHAMGFRYRLHVKVIAGKPDLVFPKYNAVVFVHGCFWHHHAACRYATIPSTRKNFWLTKFQTNIARDNAVNATLIASGWRTAIIWECALKKPDHVNRIANHLSAWLRGSAPTIEIGEVELSSIH